MGRHTGLYHIRVDVVYPMERTRKQLKLQIVSALLVKRYVIRDAWDDLSFERDSSITDPPMLQSLGDND